jgi:hypothetical protein
LHALAPTERYSESPSADSVSTCIDRKTENVHEEGCVRGAFRFSTNNDDKPVNARRREFSLPAVLSFPRVVKELATRVALRERSLPAPIALATTRPWPPLSPKLSRSRFTRGRWVNNVVGFGVANRTGFGRTDVGRSSWSAGGTSAPSLEPPEHEATLAIGGLRQTFH